MIKNPSQYNDFENNFIASQPVNVSQNINLVNDVLNLALGLGVLNSTNLDESTKLKVKIGKILNSVSRTNK